MHPDLEKERRGTALAFSLLPHRVYDSIYQLDPEALGRSGVRLMLTDLDNTISPYSISEPTEAVLAWKEKLEQHGITLFVLSNNRSATRIKRYCQMLQVPFIDHAGKPKKTSFLQAMEQMGATKEETIMVGDQIFTDVLGGNRVGIPVYLVKPIRIRDNILRILRHGFEWPFILIAKIRQGYRMRRGFIK
ncbi:MAG: YqeG family HAD IIIA-type phosphatase [Oscillospiraceae bacterium]|nr:YqeG family HAD IIIA-type phosphatase [Oscillospiraceae bacterium]